MTMADNNKSKSGATLAGDAQDASAMHVQVLGQFIKDLSFENPNIGRLTIKEGENPSITLEVDVDAKRVNTDVYESAIQFTAKAAHSGGTIYVLEVVYCGVFRLANVPPQALEPFLLINCPTLLFPFLRRIVADITREGGYPPLWLDPFDFGQLFLRRQQQLAKAAEKQ
jgi:preprotein translocase subunit SecB